MTKSVEGRRQLEFNSWEAIIQEAEHLANTEGVKTLGNWSLAQILSHLARSINMAVDGSTFRPSLMMRMMGPWMKNGMLKKTMPAGFELPRGMADILIAPTDTSSMQGLGELRDALARYQAASELKPHSVFGNMTRDDWDKLHFRHAELHLSFVDPHGA